MKRALTLSAVLLLACQTTLLDDECGKAAECGELGDDSVSQCVSSGELLLEHYRARGTAVCDDLADRQEASWACLSGMTCLSRSSPDDSSCLNERYALSDALQAAAGTCH
jgi:hypothetical protein